MDLKKSCKCFRLAEPLGQPKTVVVIVQCQFSTNESHQLTLDIFCLSDGHKRLIKNILILLEFLSISSTGYFNVQAQSDSSNTFRIKLFRLSKLKENHLYMSVLNL